MLNFKVLVLSRIAAVCF